MGKEGLIVILLEYRYEELYKESYPIEIEEVKTLDKNNFLEKIYTLRYLKRLLTKEKKDAETIATGTGIPSSI